MKKRILLTILSIISFAGISFAQQHYQKGWEYLNKADLNNAINSFEKALKDRASKEKAQLTLNLIYGAIGNKEKASALFNEFYDNSTDPSAELFALWTEEGVIGLPKKYKPYQFELLKKIEADKRIYSKFGEIVKSSFFNHYVFSNNVEKLREYENKMTSITNWSLAGPFDNVMNSGFNKDVGAVKNPETTHKFQSRYGANVSWFVPTQSTYGSYHVKKYFFSGDNSISYGQSFIESSTEQDVIMKFGYGGSLKIWLNDSLAYSESERRRTESDYFQIKCRLNKGFNRVLVQLGDFEESFAYFNVRFTDTENNPLNLPGKAEYQPYQKYNGDFTSIPFFAIEDLKKKAKDNDQLYRLLLAKAYISALDIYSAEEILNELYEENPDNYLILRSLIFFYKASGNATQQNKTYETYSELYPEDYDVVSNNFKSAVDKADKSKIREHVTLIKKLFAYDKQKVMLSDVVLLSTNEDIENLIKKVEEVYAQFPDDADIISLKYRVQKSMESDPKKLNEILQSYLENNFNSTISETLKRDFMEQGRLDDAIKQLHNEKKLSMNPLLDRQIVNVLSRKRAYSDAIQVCLDVIKKKPSDYETLIDLALLHKLTNDKKSALDYYEKGLSYFPFSFEYNEKLRELKELKPTFDVVKGLNPAEVIKDYEKNFKADIKYSYDIVSEKQSFVIFKSKATGSRISYIIKINQESAIEEWQKIQLSTGSNNQIQVNEVKTIKKNGNKLDAERNDDEWVLTNLEVGDYVYVDYVLKQTDGGKSSLFIYDYFSINSFRPVYKREYTVYAEEGVSIKDTVINGTQKPKKGKSEGFDTYTWAVESQASLKSEYYTPAFSDIGTTVQVSLGNSWNDIARWYSDLSEKQAQPDFTIHAIVKYLFDGKQYTDIEKARIIYDFVCKNIQYSSIDFRQGSYIPQKASTVYHTRLGDCKDVSTLYASIARAAGLKVNLVLINTRDNGQKNVVLPSLNFNHCIVRVQLQNTSLYLELTDTDLPFGYLYYTHNGASILEIPASGEIPENITLGTLKLNEGFTNKVIRNGSIILGSSNNVNIKNQVIKIGTQASNMYDAYYYSDEAKQKEDLKKSVSNDFTSPVKLNELVFEKFQPRKDTASYRYTYTVENEIKKAGSFRTFRIPFADVIAKMDAFDDEDRVFPFDYNYYEPVEYYDETLVVNLEGNLKLMEIPEDVKLDFNGNQYALTFTKIDERQLKIRRTYNAIRENISAVDYAAFKNFIAKAVEADNTLLVLK